MTKPLNKLKNSLLIAVGSACALAQMAHAATVITSGNTSIGVNDIGSLNVFGNGPGGTTTYGIYRAGVGDAISPGCPCEGWGVAATLSGGGRVSGFANQSTGNGGLSGGTFGSTASTATSNVNLSAANILVQHAYGPSLAPDVFLVQVSITNTTGAPLTDLVYRRVMDWDVTPTAFNEYVTHQGVVANLTSNGGNVLFASDNGFASSDPQSGPSALDFATINTDFQNNGPDDHGSLFDFAFGTLADTETRVFNIFYGSAASEAAALADITQLGIQVYSLGKNSTPAGLAEGTPGTFLFGFAGVGGVESGETPDNPILPFVPAPGEFEFPAPRPGRWYDPPFAEGFEYTLDGGATFTLAGAPPSSFGFGDVGIYSGVDLLATLAPGDTYDFAGHLGLASFSIRGIAPLIDTAGGSFATIFPTLLDWTGTATTLHMDAILVPDGPAGPAVPEPGTFGLLALAGSGLALARLRRKT